MVYSASIYLALSEFDNPMHYMIRQSIFVGISFFVTSFMFFLPTKILKSTKIIMLAVFGIMALLIYLIFFGEEINGAKGWIDLGPIGLQPAEFTKIIVIWYFASVFSKKQSLIVNNFRKFIVKPLSLVVSIIFLIVIQPDVGGALIVLLVAFVMIISSGVSTKISFFFIGLGISGISAFFAAVIHFGEKMFPHTYQYNRFLAFWDPFSLSESTGLQLINSYYALSRGGLFGVGIGESVQKTGYLPEPYTDFIVSIVGEELGLVGIGALILLLAFLILRIFLVGIRAKSPFNSLVSIGVASLLLIQTSINLGGVLGLMPVTGVTFPFISYGGSSVLTISIGIGAVLNVSAQEKYIRQQNNHPLK